MFFVATCGARTGLPGESTAAVAARGSGPPPGYRPLSQLLLVRLDASELPRRTIWGDLPNSGYLSVHISHALQ